MTRLQTFILTAMAAVLVSSGAEAHAFGTEGAGLSHGFAHPFGGLDHLLAMVTVGLWAAQRGGKAVWLMPTAFMSSMVIGGALGFEGVALPMVELAIAASLVVLGSVVALSFQPPVWLGMAIVGLFAVFHGHAHGAEMPEAASPILYAGGFVVATGILHATGIAACLGARRSQLVAKVADKVVQWAGAVVAASGLLLAVV